MVILSTALPHSCVKRRESQLQRFTGTNSMSRRGSIWQLRSQRSASILDARICLPQRVLKAEAYDVRMRKARIRRPEIWLVRQRSVTTVDGRRTGSERPTISVPILLYIWWGIREILTSVAPLELRQA